jgi:hypothetical protein
MRAATLESGRILAVNRSLNLPPYIVNEVVTGEFLRQALDGLDFDYLSDTASSDGDDSLTLNLTDMLSYELLVIGAESGRRDDLGGDPVFGGKLDSIAYYLSLGGKVILFGRWGDITSGTKLSDTIYYQSGNSDYAYRSRFHINGRVQYFTTYNGTTLFSDLIGAKSQVGGYPDLTWDSLASVDHSYPWTIATGIPCPTFALMASSTPQILYKYDSRNNAPYSEGRTVAWRYRGPDYQYILFNIPLSFMNRTQAVTALQMAVSELLSAGPAAQMVIDPNPLDIPHYGNPTVSIFVGNFREGKTAADVNSGSVMVNTTIVPATTSILPSHPAFSGEVLQVEVSTSAFLASYGADPIGTVDRNYRTSWTFAGESETSAIDGQVTMIGYDFRRGDGNGDGTVNIGDAVYLINFIFRGGPAPVPNEAGDPNCSDNVDIGDIVYLVNYVFKGGPPPGPVDCGG